MPMIAFIGVRISWLMAARKVLLAWLACSAASCAARPSSKRRAFWMAIAACCDEAHEEVEVGRGEDVAGCAERQTAIMPMTSPRARSGAAMIRYSTSSSSVPGIVTVRRRWRRR